MRFFSLIFSLGDLVHIKTILATAVLSLAAVSASAGDWYGVGSIGRSSLPNDNSKGDIDSALVSAGATGLSSSFDDSDTGYKLQLGYQFNQNWAVEGGYVDLGEFKYHASYTGGAANAKAKADGWNIDVVGILPINDQFSVFGKLGFIDAKVKIDASATGPGGSASGSADDTCWKGTWGVGATYNFSKTIGIRAEWERFDKLGDKGSTGESNVNLLSVGLSFKF